jgi:hypothetical protein
VGSEDYVFVVREAGRDQSLWLGRNVRSGVTYGTARWTNLGTAKGGLELAASRTSAWVDYVGEKVHVAFLCGSHIWLVSGKDENFGWVDLGTPEGKTIILCYGAVLIGGLWPAVPVRTADEHIWINSWDNSSKSRRWTDLGKPAIG